MVDLSTIDGEAESPGPYKYWGNDRSRNTIEVYKDSQFINTCSMYRRLKLDDLNDGAYNLAKDSKPMGLFGYSAKIRNV